MPRPTLNWLLVFLPVSIVAAGTRRMPVLVFLTACLAIVPLAGLIGRATGELALRSGPRAGGLLNATFGNVTELILGVMLVRAGEFDVVKSSLIGSILGNLVLVLGAAYLAGGLRFKEQAFNPRTARAHSASLLLAVTGLLMPAVFVLTSHETVRQRLVVSSVVAVVLITLYCAALVFSFVTHTHLFQAAVSDQRPQWSGRRSVSVLLVAAIAVGVESELLVTSLEPATGSLGLSKVFVGLFVVAIVGNAAEHASAVLLAIRDQMDVAIEIAFGSSTQIALLVAPFLVFASFALGRSMDFIFTPFEVIAVSLAALIVSIISLDGRANWLEGAQLLGVYVIVAVSAFYIS